jgi:hypothetical protein
MPTTNLFFAILKDDTIKRVSLNQDITLEVKKVFEDAQEALLPNDIEEVKFDGAFNVQDDEILYVELPIPTLITDAIDNPSGTHPFDINSDELKGLFWGKKLPNNKYEISVQNFDSRKLLNNKQILVYSSNTYSKLEKGAFILDYKICGVFKDDKFFFKSYHNAKRIFDLSHFYTEATDDDIDKFVEADCIDIDSDWLKENSNTSIRKQVTLALKNDILKNTSASQIRTKSNGYLPFTLNVVNNKIEIPEDKKECRLFLEFLNEQIYKGIFSGKVKRTNSSMDLNE